MYRKFALIFAAMITAPVTATAYERINDRALFVATVGGKDFRIAAYGLTLNLLDNGSISCRAVGYDITGFWSW